jgi:hypothetical protein
MQRLSPVPQAAVMTAIFVSVDPAIGRPGDWAPTLL